MKSSEASSQSTGGRNHPGSVSIAIALAKDGDPLGQVFISKRFWNPLVALASRVLRSKGAAVCFADEVANDVLLKFFMGARCGVFPKLEDRGALSRLFSCIVWRLVSSELRAERAKKRGGGHVRRISDFGEPGQADFARQLDELVRDVEPSPEAEAIAADAIEFLCAELSPELRIVFRLIFEGWSQREIAEQMKTSQTQVSRLVAEIRKTLEKLWETEGADG
jgi:RNA polymerase sigma factor (sigma-70 family)